MDGCVHVCCGVSVVYVRVRPKLYPLKIFFPSLSLSLSFLLYCIFSSISSSLSDREKQRDNSATGEIQGWHPKQERSNHSQDRIADTK